MEQMPSWLISIVQTGGVGAVAAVLIFAVWWITTKFNERRQDKLLSTIQKEREAATEQAREDRKAYTDSIERVTRTLVDEIHVERDRVFKAHEKDSEEDRAVLKQIGNSLEVLVGKIADSKLDHMALAEAINANAKNTERLEHAINKLAEKQ